MILAAWILKLMVKAETLNEENTNLLRRIVLLEAEAHMRCLEDQRKDVINATALHFADSLKKVKDAIEN